MTDQVTGEQLFDELCAAATSAGVGVGTFAAALFPASWKIEQMRIARQPKPETVERVRALIAGDPIAPPSAGRCIRADHAQANHRTEILRDIGELAHATRRPGQTLADRARELRRELLCADKENCA